MIGQRYVPVIRRGNDNAVDVLSRQYLTKVLVSFAIICSFALVDLCSKPFATVPERIGGGEELDILVRDEIAPAVAAAAPARTKGGQRHAVARRVLAEHARRHDGWESRHACGKC